MIARRNPKETSWLWMAKIASGVLIVVILIIHLVANHLMPGGLKHYSDVVTYLSNPWIALMEETFLVLAVSHALIGTRGIILDLNPPDRVMRWIDPGIIAVGLFSISYGIWLVQTIIHHGVGG